MKIICHKHMLHFEDEFEDTMKDDCPVWRENFGSDLTELPRSAKKYIWNYLFGAFDHDYFLEKYGYECGVWIKVRKVDPERLYKNINPDWESLPDAERREIERQDLRDYLEQQKGKET